MNNSALTLEHKVEISDLFTTVFSASEGDSEGQLIGELAAQLAAGIDDTTTLAFGTFDQDQLIAVIFFTRLSFSSNEQVFMLAPVGVATEHQGTGVGQSLIEFGLAALKAREVAVAITYGDPAFYSKVGFEPLSEEVIQAPLPLSMPIGWQGQSLTDKAIAAISERPTCVEPFNDASYW